MSLIAERKANESLREQRTVSVPVSGGIVTTDSQPAKHVDVLADNNFTLANPLNPVHGRILLFALKQDGTGSRIMVLGSEFQLSDNISDTNLSTTPNAVDFMAVQYDENINPTPKWIVLAFTKG